MVSKRVEYIQETIASPPFLVCGFLAIGLGLYGLRRRRGRTDVRGEVIFITGCDSGFGFSLALHCAQMEMDVVAGCFTGGEGRQVLENMENMTVVDLDVRSENSVVKAVEQVRQICVDRGLFCLVNNAATLVFGEATWQTEEQILNQVNVNMVGPLRMTKACLTLLVKARGRVVNMISNCTECPLPTLAVYTASKAGLLALSDGMRVEMKKYGIAVVIVNPGDAPFNTPLTSGQSAHYEKMQKGMSEDSREVYGEYFERCRDKFTTLFPGPSLQKIVDPSYYNTMERVLQEEIPQPFYENSPLVTGIIFGVIKRLPRTVADGLRLSMVKLPDAR